jgi:hypothetical protein
MDNEGFADKPNGRPHPATTVEISDTIVIGRKATATAAREQEQEFEVVGIVEDESSARYAVCYCEASDEFIVTDDAGILVADEALAQKVLEDFLEQTQGADNEEDD